MSKKEVASVSELNYKDEVQAWYGSLIKTAYEMSDLLSVQSQIVLDMAMKIESIRYVPKSSEYLMKIESAVESILVEIEAFVAKETGSKENPLERDIKQLELSHKLRSELTFMLLYLDTRKKTKTLLKIAGAGVLGAAILIVWQVLKKNEKVETAVKRVEVTSGEQKTE